MTTFYLDLEGGSDAADGTSYANRWKTFDGGATAARIAAGDTIRVMASPTPHTPGSATWTDNDATVTWAAQKNKSVEECESGWVAATNITAAHVTTQYKSGSASLSLTPAAGFTTGKMAYKTISSTDFSAYEQLSLWTRSNSTGYNAAGRIEVKLCSDTTGDTPVDTFALGAITSSWRAHVVNKAAALGAAIQSVAIYATVDPGTSILYVDNIVAAKAVGNADECHLGCVIGKNTGGEPDWYAIESIGESSIEIGGHHLQGPGSAMNGTAMPYRGTSESVATYLRKGIDMSAAGTSDLTAQDTGTAALPITYSGGWNRTDMSTQTGVTYISNMHYEAGQALSATTNADWNRFENFGFMYMYAPFNLGAGADNCRGFFDQAVGCFQIWGPNASAGEVLEIDSVHACYRISDSTSAAVDIKARRLHGCNYSTPSTYAPLMVTAGSRYRIDKVDNCAKYAVDASSATYLYGDCYIYGTTFENIGTAIIGAEGLRCHFINCTTVAPSEPTTGAAVAHLGNTTTQTNQDGDATSHKSTYYGFNVQSEATVRHTASGIAWRLEPTVLLWDEQKPATFVLARIAVAASSEVTVTCYCRRSHTDLSCGIRLPGGIIPGEPDDVDDTMTEIADAWEQLTIQFTPTQAGVVEIWGFAYGATTQQVYFDDMTISQA